MHRQKLLRFLPRSLVAASARWPGSARVAWPVVVSLCALTRMHAGISPAEQDLVQHIRAQQGEFVRRLEEVVRLDSATENLPGVRRMGGYFDREFAALGFNTRWVDLPREMNRAGHLFAERTGKRGKRLLLIGHLDTVLPGGAYRREGDRAYGSGVNDMKGGNLIMLQALSALNRIGALDDVRITVCLTGDEEAPGDDLAIARRDLIDAAKRSDFALAFEGAYKDTVTVARRGITFWSLEVQGATGHSAGIFSSAVGSGAVFETARILAGFHEQLRREDGLTINPAIIVGGTTAGLEGATGTATGKPNVIAQRALVRGDLRFQSSEQLERVKALMHETVARHLPRTRAELRFEDRYPAMVPTAESIALLAQLDQVSRDLGYGKIEPCDPRIRGAGDISFVSPFLPGLDGLGPRGEGAHAPNEDIDLASIPELIERTALLIYRLTR